MRSATGQTIHLKDYSPPAYTIESVELHFNLEPQATRVRSRLIVKRERTTAKDKPLLLDGEEVKLISLEIEGRELDAKDYSASPDRLIINRLPAKKTFTLEIETEIDPQSNTQLMGLYRSSGNYCTQCEAEGFRRITYYLDRPDVMAVFTTRIDADQKDAPVLLGNGNLVESGPLPGNRHFAVWHDPHPKPCYLFALVAGDLGSIREPFVTASGKDVELGIYVEKGKERYAEYAMDALIRSMRWDEQVFGREYDLYVFNIVAVSDFNMGAMENKGLNIFNDKYVLADPNTATDTDYENIEAIIAHEYFHNWTGNRITCRDWFQLCLKEGLTVYRDQEFSADQRSRPVQRIADVRRLKSVQFPEDSGPLAHPVRPKSYKEINNFYTATVYEKGAELVRMIATLLGPKNFKKGMDLYFKRHDGEAATIEQFLKCFEQAGKTNLAQFMLWYEQAGTPKVNIVTKYDSERAELEIEVQQKLDPTPGQKRKAAMHIPLRVGLIDRNGEDIHPKDKKGPLAGDLLEITKAGQKVKLKGIGERPVLSLNRNFSAPVNVEHRRSPADLKFLAIHDSDLFSRWDAMNTFAMRQLVSGVVALKRGSKFEPDHGYLEAAREILADESLEASYRATMLTLPSDADIAKQIGRNVDPDAIAKVLKAMKQAVGKSLEPIRAQYMPKPQTRGAFDPGAEAAGQRSLRSALMNLAVATGLKPVREEIHSQYSDAKNMTDRFNSLRLIAHHFTDKEIRQEVLEDFYKRYKKNHIVLDKWFSVQASRPASSAVTDVKKLMQHEDFQFKNPNRLRSLVGVFAAANQTGFHAASGKGYELVANTVEKVDGLNPQVAARLLTAFGSYNSLEKNRRTHARRVLKALSEKSDLSLDVREILDKMLEA